MNPLAIVVAAVAAFVASAAWYVAFSRQMARVSPAFAAASESATPTASQILMEMARGLIVAVVVAGIAAGIGIADAAAALLLGASLWVGFPVVLLWGSVIHENVPLRLAAIHAGDWLVKLLLIAVIVGVWR
jgi:hypothetical protein